MKKTVYTYSVYYWQTFIVLCFYTSVKGIIGFHSYESANGVLLSSQDTKVKENLDNLISRIHGFDENVLLWVYYH